MVTIYDPARLDDVGPIVSGVERSFQSKEEAKKKKKKKKKILC